jgi:rod shape-determining protein MreC
MDRLLNFIFQYRAFFTFLLLELLCAWLIVENNQYQSTRFFNSANSFAANIISFSQGVREYFSLKKINSELADENARLRTELENNMGGFQDSVRHEITDSAMVKQFDFVAAKVINNSTLQYKNFITINKGRLSGISPGMAVISSRGAVGKVKSISDHYAVLISLLNIDEQVSSKIKRTGHFGTIQWDGADPTLIDLHYIPRHVEPRVGDTVVTSGFNAVFPENVMVGVIQSVNLKDEDTFYSLKVELAQDFSKLAFVEVVRNALKDERDSLEILTTGIPK